MDQIFTMTTTFVLVPKVIKTKIAEVIKEHKTTILNCKKKVTKELIQSTGTLFTIFYYASGCVTQAVNFLLRKRLNIT